MQSNFRTCLAFTLEAEGGYANLPGDHGGPTKYGITISTLSAFYGRICTVEDVEEMSEEVAGLIYQKNFWNPMACGRMPDGVDLMVWDFGVNAGPTASVRLLQKLVGCAPDGSFGPKTLGAVLARPAALLVNQLSISQQSYYHSLAGFNEFGKGWIDRTLARQKAALGLAAQHTA